MTYVTTDLHGYPLEKFKDFLDKVGFSDEDILYILGDVIDRGTDGIKILKWMMRTPNVRLIRGNHEDMFLNCDFLFEGDSIEDVVSTLSGTKMDKYKIWRANGGNVTLEVLSAMRNKEIQYILEYVKKAPLYETLNINGNDFILVHSGLGGFRKGKELSDYTSDELIWTRPSLSTRYFGGFTVVFGHTPTVAYGNEYLGKIVKTDTWVNVDVGVGIGQQPVLFRLDDMKQIYYNSIKGENENEQ